MAIGKKYINGITGRAWVEDPELAYVEMMLVLREGQMRVEASTTPIGKEFLYNEASGRIDFDADQPFENVIIPPFTTLPCQIYIEYKY